MVDCTIEITGVNRDQLAKELGERLTEKQGIVQVHSETERGVDPIAVVSVVLAGIQTAGVIWAWWESRRRTGGKVTIRTAAGHVIELSDIDRSQLEITLTEDE